ncbi:TonB-dependent receptor [Fodinibius salsisoli]|uniref:TonB-dependent receptor n=1 Tax=Fodinibius salsisoli TaxID=2820877 RepID=A0ABT3PNM1_9BACT|nr:TonB-dependent receptor [Fodinibius salsisoli]MCW9707449.1 TonB-dependent receptor [Fodinibius salsisoli]
MDYKKVLCGVFLCCVFIPILRAQEVQVHGIISDRQTGNSLEMANIILKQLEGKTLTTGTTTDTNGLYEMGGLTPGTYLFTVRYVGYETYTDTLRLASNRSYLKNIRLNRWNESLDEVTVSGVQENVEVGKVSIRPEDLGRIPSPAASGDLASYLQTQPGVVATGDRGGQLFIRGGTPTENLVLVDGVQIYQPFHILGFFSIFPEEVVSKVDLYAGGFGAEYHGRTSSVMDIQLKNGNLYDYKWSASISPFVSDVFFETPVKEGKSSLMISMKGSLIEESSQLYLDEKQPLRFNSQLAKYSSVGENVNCSALLMRTYDRGRLDFEGDEFFKWNNVVAGGRCAGVSEESSVSFFDLNVGFSYFSNEAGSADTRGRFSNIFKSDVDISLVQNLGEVRLDYGFYTDFRNLHHDMSSRFRATEEKKRTFLSTGLYVKATIPFGNKVSIVPGVSASSYLGKVKAGIEPRFQMSWRPRGKVNEEVNVALGIYHQPLVGISDFRDAGTAFTAWRIMPDQERRMGAKHAILGWHQPIGRYFDFSVEGYYKQMDNIPVAAWSTVAQSQTELAYAKGSSMGTDIRLDFDSQNVYFGVGYGYALTEYETAQDHFSTWFGTPVQSYNPPHDRRHKLNVKGGFDYKGFTANVSWIYGSGLPFTRPLGFDSYFSFEERPPEIRDDYGDPRILMEKPFQGRLPEFHRLDVSLEQAIKVSDDFITRLQIGAVNAYDKRNLFFYDVYKQQGINQLSFMPYVSLKIESM